jgi:hypothetical protein
MKSHGRTLRNISLVLVIAVALVALGSTALAREDGPPSARAQAKAHGLEGLGLRAYWSVLREDQKSEAKAIIADHLARTASDRLAALAHCVQFKADVVALLTPEQRKAAWRLARLQRHTPRGERIAALDRLLDGTDRAALADEVESLGSATPEEKVRIGLAIHDRLYGLVEPKVAEALDLTPDQRDRLRDLYEGLKTDLEPIAVRIATAKAEDAQRGMALLDDQQRETLKRFGERVAGKVLTFIRG